MALDEQSTASIVETMYGKAHHHEYQRGDMVTFKLPSDEPGEKRRGRILAILPPGERILHGGMRPTTYLIHELLEEGTSEAGIFPVAVYANDIIEYMNDRLREDKQKYE